MKNVSMMKVIGGLLVSFSAIALATPSYAFDEDAAKETFKRNECTKCHAVNRDKKGPSLQKIAKELKGKADAQDKIIKNITTGPKVKLLDSGKEEEHKIIDTKDPKELKNLVEWILSH
ncbi:MAG: c-type cytochrome [Burkholderiales bacterium]